MKFFIDTANIDEIKELNDWGVLDGVTTNPSLIYKSGKDFKSTIKEISSMSYKSRFKPGQILDGSDWQLL